ncbi:MAG: hypothetical protein B6I38_01395 [Anaerolineaceae bacterium 4572_5.1]|nr:MAG: hypothetical protein B6I38_01395 [Anaerolineaceae bacterium 4572_5.1]
MPPVSSAKDKEINLRTAIVTDSTSDIPASLREKYNIFEIPAILVIEGKESLDGVGISRNEFYNRMPTMNTAPTTAAPSVGSFQNLYRHLFDEGYTEIISIHASSKLSGIFNSARIAAQGFKENINVIDSQQLTLGLGFQVIAAAKAAIQKLPVEKILARITNIQKRVNVVALLDTLEYVRRSGRVSWAKASLGTLLHIKPFLTLANGTAQSFGASRSRKKGVLRLLNLLQALGPLEYLAILHSNAKEDAQRFFESYPHDLPEQTFIVNVTTIIGTHVGPNGLGYAAVVK